MNEPATDHNAPAPLTRQRIQDALNSLEVNHGTDNAGEIIAQFDDNMFWFLCVGEQSEIFHARAAWKAWLPAERKAEALEAVNEWNGSRFFPSVSLKLDGDGDVLLQAVRSTDMEFGVTDSQLVQEIRSTVAPSLQFFDFLEERFPGSVAAAEAYRSAQQ